VSATSGGTRLTTHTPGGRGTYLGTHFPFLTPYRPQLGPTAGMQSGNLAHWQNIQTNN